MQFNLHDLHFTMRMLLIGMIGVLSLTEMLFAADVRAQILDRKISVELRAGTMTQALHTLANEKVYIAFDDTEFDLSKKRINAKTFSHTPVRDVLTYLFAGSGLIFKESGAYIMLEKKVPQRPGTISGKIYDERGLPLAGANIRVPENGRTVQARVDGSYQLELPAGTYQIEISYVSYQTQRVQGVRVRAGQATPLDVSMRIAKQQLEDVVVTVNFKQAAVAGLYAVQKNAASVTDGISAEQIARTPDNDIGQVLKRVTGITTVNNSRVVVRGMSDRYNQAMLDGVTIPSTSMNRRDFSFDIIPTAMVSAIVVNKTATPDVSSEFSGGQISVNTLAIPDQNFTSVQVGLGGNSQTTGKDFYRLGERTNSEFFGFFDPSAKAPKDIQSWNFGGSELPPPGISTDPDIPGATEGQHLIGENSPLYRSFDAIAQSKRFSADNLKLYRYKAAPNQNYLFGLGRVYRLGNGLRLGFSASASLRTEHQTTPFNNVRGSSYAGGVHYIDSTGLGQNGAGMAYRFNSISGLLANLGLQGERMEISLKNMYSRTYNNTFFDAVRLNYEDVTLAPNLEQYQQPQAMSLQQHQLNGSFKLPWNVKMDALFAYNKIKQQILDERKLEYRLTTSIGDRHYFQTPNIWDPARSGGTNTPFDYRMWADVNEDDFNWGLNFARPIVAEGAISTLFRTGYQGWTKRRDLSITRMIPYTARGSMIEQPYEVVLNPENMGSALNQAYYWAENTNGSIFNGRIDIHALYVMADQKLWHKLRLVYGLRGELFRLNNSQEELLDRQYTNQDELIQYRRAVSEKGWRWLPSLNATYEVTPRFNIRGSYARTAIRPDFRESSFFGFYDYELDGNISGDRVESTIVDNVDARLEWYPSPGELVSLTGYYKYLDRPIELIKIAGTNQYAFTNMASATNLGLELELRKNFSFLGSSPWLRDLFVFGNGSLLRSEVDALSQWRYVIQADGSNILMQTEEGVQDRPLLGQSPWLLNAGLGYWGEYMGLTASYNQRGYRTNITHTNPNLVEYEQAPRQLDAQIYARFLKKKLEMKLNMANILNEWAIYYTNTTGYTEINQEGGGWIPVEGKSNRYRKEDGDNLVYRRKEGQRFNLSLTYSF
ncbi:TonB-dependent receptor [Sphingobacterium griseoflavum]|uniref:TonB-dependent receptor n=1 Tax=Sphingobacterium griseoflavum TaxID=1474952 RepID=A0ABQ3HSQ0_9SPHI|nr:TonB-dependent receptor [Sphingobacterium griseoflavum]GHE23378.1 TonB-dependent receptor [Sphingobacterium griseoflavum]